VLVFEDSIAGVQAALAAGMQCCWVPHPCFDITSQASTVTIPSLEDFVPEHFHLPWGYLLLLKKSLFSHFILTPTSYSIL